MLISTGRGPLNLAEGRERTPDTVSPSKLFHSTVSGAGSTSALNDISLVVQRVSAPSEVSTEYTSAGTLTDSKLKPTSREFGRHRTRPATPFGIAGIGRALSVVRSNTWISLLEPRSTTAATSVPSGESSKPLPRSVGPSRDTPSGVTAVHVQLLRSHRQIRQSPLTRSLIA